MQSGVPIPGSLPTADTTDRLRSGVRQFRDNDGGTFDALVTPPTQTGGDTPAETTPPPPPRTGGDTPAEPYNPSTPKTGGGHQPDVNGVIMPNDGGGAPVEFAPNPNTGGGTPFDNGELPAPHTGGGQKPETQSGDFPKTGGGGAFTTVPAQPATGGGGQFTNIPAQPTTGGGSPADTAMPTPSTGGGGQFTSASLGHSNGNTTPTASVASTAPNGSQQPQHDNPGVKTTLAAPTIAPSKRGVPVEGEALVKPDSAAKSQASMPAQTATQGQSVASQLASSQIAAQARPAQIDSLRGSSDDGHTRAILENTPTASTAGKAAATNTTKSAAPTMMSTPAQGSATSAPQTAPNATDMPPPTKAAPDLITNPPVQNSPASDAIKTNPDVTLDRAHGLDSTVKTGEAHVQDRSAALANARMTPHSAAHLAAQVARKFASGSRQFDIRMDPAELGRVDVRLQVSNDNRVHAILSAERSETLAELQRNARDLERALNDAGLELGDAGLEFQLSQGDSDRSSSDGQSNQFDVFAEAEALQSIESASHVGLQQMYGFSLAQRSGVDVRI